MSERVLWATPADLLATYDIALLEVDGDVVLKVYGDTGAHFSTHVRSDPLPPEDRWALAQALLDSLPGPEPVAA